MAVTALGQVEYNGLNLASSVYELQSIEGLAEYPEVRSSDAPLLARHGFHAGYDWLGGRRITITLAIHASTQTAFRDAVVAVRNAFVPRATDLPLTFRLSGIGDSNNCFVNCRPRRLSMPMTNLWNGGFSTVATIELFAARPFIHGATEKNSSMTMNAGSGTLNNAGNWPQLTRIMISVTTGPLTGATVQNNNLSVLKLITLTGSYASGDTVYILVPERNILYDANPPGGTLTSVYGHMGPTSEWWELVPGNNSIVTSRTAGTATATLFWYDTWV